MERISKIWPKWSVESVLGQGGFGTVYKAKREQFGDVSYSAIKVVRIPQNDAEIREMSTSGLIKQQIQDYYAKSVRYLVDEIKMMENLKSANNIVNIEDYEVVENEDGFGWTVYIRMELLTNLHDYFSKEEMTVEKVVKLGVDICNALEYCHNSYIIHRDIKPGNIFVSKFGDFKLGDFGVSREAEKAMATMSQKGTKSYMAPEMIGIGKYNHTVDLYALGLTMYELLNHNRMPFLPAYPAPYFPNDREEAMLRRLKGEEFPDIEGIGELNAILKKACHFNPNERYQTASEFKAALLTHKSSQVENIEWEVIEDKTEDPIMDGDCDSTDDETIGMFKIVKEDLFKDEMKETTVKNEEESKDETVYHIQASKYKKAYLVFKNGYYDGNKVIIQSDDAKTKKMGKLFKEYLQLTNDLDRKNKLKQMIKFDDYYTLHLLLASVGLSNSTWKTIHNEFQIAYQMNPNDAMTNKTMALLAYENKEYDRALQFIEKSYQLYNEGKTSVNHQIPQICAIWAVILQKLKFEKEALGKIKEASRAINAECAGYNFKLKGQAVSKMFMYDCNFNIDYDLLERLFATVKSFNIGRNVYKKIIENNFKAKKVSFSSSMYDGNMIFLESNHMFKKYFLGNYGYLVDANFALRWEFPYFMINEQCEFSIEKNIVHIYCRDNDIPFAFKTTKTGDAIFGSLMDLKRMNGEL